MQEFQVAWNDQHAKSKSWPIPVPHFNQLSPYAIEYIMAFYMRDELDETCSGADRHERFAEWAAKNYAMLSRDVAKLDDKMLAELRQLSATRPIKALPSHIYLELPK
jgi:hypothetical protein